MTERDATAGHHGDEGFTLIEVMVALGIFMVVVTALLPQIMAGLRAVITANSSTVVETVSQQEVERLRNLPFRVSLGGAVVDGVQTEADVDLLDFYFPDRTPATAPSSADCGSGSAYELPVSETAWHGYVTPTGTNRCDYEPTGAFYRTVTLTTRAPLGDIAIVRDLQFLTAGTSGTPTPAPVEPAGTYSSEAATTNAPPSNQVGLTVTVLYDSGGKIHAHTDFTQIARHDVTPALLHSAVDVEAIKVSSRDPAGAAVSLTAGTVGLEGSLGDASVASASLSAVTGRIATGDPATSLSGYGAARTFAVPPTKTVDTVTDPGLAACGLLCWGTSQIGPDVTGGDLTADAGLPRAGTSDRQLRASVTGTGREAFAFDNSDADYRSDLELDRAKHAVSLVGDAPPDAPVSTPTQCPAGIGATSRLSGSAFLQTSQHPDEEGVLDTSLCGGAQSATVAVLPTDWAPDGVVQLTLRRSYAWCGVTDGTADGGGGLDVRVRVSDGAGGYQEEKDASDFDPADETVGDHGALTKYLTGWAYAAPEVTKNGAEVTVSGPGLTVTTAATRLAADDTPDEDSAVLVTLGAASCSSKVGS